MQYSQEVITVTSLGTVGILWCETCSPVPELSFLTAPYTTLIRMLRTNQSQISRSQPLHV